MPSKIKVCDFESLIRRQDKILFTEESALEKFFFVYLLLKWIILVRGILWGLILWKFLLCNWLGYQTFVVHRSRNEYKLLHIKKNG